MLLQLLVGCVPASSPESALEETGEVCEPTLEVLVDTGQACVLTNVDGSVTLQVALAAFGGCTEALEMGCTANVDGDRIDVVASLTLEVPCETAVCPLDLEVAIAICQLPTLGAGPYTLSYAGSETTFGIPVDGGSACAGSTPSTL